MAALFPIRCLGDKSATLGTRRQKVDLVQPAENGTKPASSDVTSLKIEAPATGMIGFKMIVYVYIYPDCYVDVLKTYQKKGGFKLYI